MFSCSSTCAMVVLGRLAKCGVSGVQRDESKQ
jgi:hypothetical protein